MTRLTPLFSRFSGALAALLLLCAAPLSAQPTRYYFEHYTTYEGLPSNTIHCCFQDHFGFMWIGTRDGLCRFDGYDFRTIGGDAVDNPTNLATQDITEDEDGLLWFTTSTGVGYYDPYTGEPHTFGRLGTSLCFDFAADLKGSVWFAGDKIYRFVKEVGEFKSYGFQGTSPTHVTVDSYGTVWALLGDNTLHYYNKRQDRFERVPFAKALGNIQPAGQGQLLASSTDGDVLLIDTSNMESRLLWHTDTREIRHILERKSGEYWIGTNDGLFIVSGGDTVEVRHDNSERNSLSANFITSLARDNSGNVWVGTYYAGLNIWQDKQDEFIIYYPNPSPRSMRGEVVRSIETDDDGNVWFCTEDGGLNCLPVNRQPGINFVIVPDLNMQDLTIIGDEIWIHTFNSGVYVFDRKEHKVLRHYDVPNSSGMGLLTSDGRLLTGSMFGLYVLDRRQDRFVPWDKNFTAFVHTLFQESRGNIWLGTYGDGLYCLDRGGRRLLHLTSADRRHGLTADRITSFFEDSRHRIWITTEGGGVCYTDPEPNLSDLKLHAVTRAEGLSSNVTCAVAEDEDGMIWVTTTRGIMRLNGETAQIEDYILDRQQVIGSQFSYGAVETTRSGMIYFGNTAGLICFSPAKMKRAVRNYPLYITSIDASNAQQTLHLHELDRATIHTQSLKIRSRDASTISISFAAPDYSILRQVSYSYTLTRGRRELSSGIQHENTVHFSGLLPGHYHFEVGILGSDAPASHRSLDFYLQPPLMMSTPAQIIYLVLLLAMVAMGLYQMEMKRRRDRARHLTRVENQKQKEIYEAKINFFTNLTHEIRTPLSLIKMPLDKLIAEKEYTPKAEKDMLTIQASTNRLLNLTNQLLDLRKMEKNEVKPVFLKEDLSALVRRSCELFAQMAEEQKIQLTMNVPEEPFMVMCTRDAVEKIVSNLLSNAVKYTTDRIDVSLTRSPDGQQAILRVDSNGPRISLRDSEKIFEIFYQAGDTHKGTGLGLPYARTLANLHGGRLYLDTAVQDCNSFVLRLPVEQVAPVQLDSPDSDALAFSAQEPDPNAEHENGRYTLLIVEDSVEMRNYLAAELSDEYNIITAANGEDAVEKLHSERVDLVVSDIMMPVMDGCQLCNYVKTNMEFSHLPVLLLTAAVGVDTRLQTLKVGADGYIEKPFPIELLRANLSNLFKNREISYKQFTNSPLTHFNSVNTSKIDEEFMEKLHGIVMKHMAEQDLSIETLTSMIGTSKSTLYRMVKANTGLNINEYIRLCRLKQAAELLSSQKYRINEVAYMVGFSSPSYFATSFQKQFNISPSTFVKNLKQD